MEVKEFKIKIGKNMGKLGKLSGFYENWEIMKLLVDI
jgi:hypothetical protein